MYLQRRKKIWPRILILFLIILGCFGFFAYKRVKNITPESFLQSSFIKNQIKSRMGDEATKMFDIAPEILGFTKPRNILFLFANNTELRPGGGFIGSYALISADKGDVKMLKVEGTEVLDNAVDKNALLSPPEPIKNHLKVDRWYLRDSNWSPDFAESSRLAIDFYKKEGGANAEQVDTVVALTPDVLVELLKIIGPVSYGGMEFTPENVVEKLEYEVEYGFAGKGISFENRKKTLQDLAGIIMQKVRASAAGNYASYMNAARKLAEERQIMMYSSDGGFQSKIESLGWDGRVRQGEGDYLMWVDANLISLKTDHALKREISYSIYPDGAGNFIASAKMKYIHAGKFDWRTTRYYTYARVYVPEGSELINATGTIRFGSAKQDAAASGSELGKKWFGVFASLSPGHEKELVFNYRLPPSVSKDIRGGTYKLFVQKQLGAKPYGLTLNLDFDKNVTGASIPESREKWGDGKYEVTAELNTDKDFTVSFN